MPRPFLEASGSRCAKLESGWAVLGTPAGSVVDPDQLRADAEANVQAWTTAPADGTVASMLQSAQRWSLDGPARRFDAEDWWFRLRFDAPDPGADARQSLFFGGLATLAEVWLNGELLLRSNNMHLSHTCDDHLLRETGNELLMRFASLDAWLTQRRVRPRWRAPMVEHQQLRWARTTLLGRTPGWSPPAAAVGPWRDVALLETRRIAASQLRLATTLSGGRGTVSVDLVLMPLGPTVHIEEVHIEVERGGLLQRSPLRPGKYQNHARTKEDSAPMPEQTQTPTPAQGRPQAPACAWAHHYAGALTIPDPDLWWPHTHGEPALYEARIVVRLEGQSEPHLIELGAIGLRTIELDTANAGFGLRVNGVPVFCRGACWTPLDAVSLRSDPVDCHAALERVRDAGLNLLRVGGTMVYEEAHFHASCDRLGILVWQDFMFANMDYPGGDPTFTASVELEVRQQLMLGQMHPSLAVLCGNSEVEQQAAMWGAAREAWAPPLFHRVIAAHCASLRPDVPYWPSSAHGGDFPHRNDTGTTSYYGVGAYLRPLIDARRSGVRFATECLAFANVPSDATLARIPSGTALHAHHAAWKQRSPRDLGAGWDFDDIRDHYLQLLYRVDATDLRRVDPERYLELSRASSAELMYATFAEWRRPGSTCRGGLVWFLRDLWAGAGWGLLDDRGLPKAAFHGVRNACAPLALFLSDEGTNGLDLHVVNEAAEPLAATIDVALYRDDGLQMESASQRHDIGARATLSLPVGGWFDRFIDISNAYRFGPADHALVVSTLRDATGVQRAQAFHFCTGLPSTRERDIGLVGEARLRDDGSADVVLRTRGFAQSVHFQTPGFVAEDAYFHLAPGTERRVRLRPETPGSRPALRGGCVLALNAASASPLKVLP